MQKDFKPFCLRGADNAADWFCVVAGRQFGPWPDKGSALAGFKTEKRRNANRPTGQKEE